MTGPHQRASAAVVAIHSGEMTSQTSGHLHKLPKTFITFSMSSIPATEDFQHAQDDSHWLTSKFNHTPEHALQGQWQNTPSVHSYSGKVAE